MSTGGSVCKILYMMKFGMAHELVCKRAAKMWEIFQNGLDDPRANISYLLNLSSDSVNNSCYKRLAYIKDGKSPDLLKNFCAVGGFIWN